MLHRTITTLTLAAATTIVVATAAPALAAPPSADEPTVVEPCVVETDAGTIPCPVFELDLGSLLDPAPGTDDPADPGIVVDAPGIVVDPEILLPGVDLPPVLDPTPPADDPAPEDEGIERAVPPTPEEL